MNCEILKKMYNALSKEELIDIILDNKISLDISDNKKIVVGAENTMEFASTSDSISAPPFKTNGINEMVYMTR